MLTRRGATITASQSWDGQSWWIVGTDTVAFGATVYAGLAVTSHDTSTVLTATFDNVAVVSTDGGAWLTSDVGQVAVAGYAGETANGLQIAGSGADIWGEADAFRYAYREVSGDFELSARVAGVEAVNQWTKAGLMIRASLDAASAHASLFATPTSVKGVAFQRRPVSGGSTLHSAGPMAGPPVWLKLTRQGTLVTALYRNASTEEWTAIGSDVLALPPTVLVGVAVTSHEEGLLAAALIESLAVATD
jgi:hypothetical protein